MNPREQGDLGEKAAAAWLWSQGHTVAFPFGHSPDWDLMVEIDHVPLRVQVKTTGQFVKGRWSVSVCTRGGNRSWNGVVKRLSPDRCDRLFVLVGDGRQWFIPAAAVAGGVGLLLGGPKYARFEVERGEALFDLPLPAAATG